MLIFINKKLLKIERDEMLLGRTLGMGNTAEVFEIEGQEREVLKLFFEKIPYEHIKKEYETSQLINKLGIASPKVGDLVQQEKRYGIVYEKVTGNNLTHLLSTRPLSLKKTAETFARLQASFHNKRTDQLPSQKAYISYAISGTGLLTLDEKANISAILADLPEGNAVCHGDYHPDNVVFMDGEPMVLDWMTGTTGNPCGDVARTLIILQYAVLPPNMPWITRQLLTLFRKAFTKFYWNAYTKKTKMTKESVEEWTLPLMAARLVEGIPEPEKKGLVKEIRARLVFRN
jgi:uncharacterized protein (TIGR02172 family)